MSMTIWLILSDLIWIACKLATTRAWHEQLGQKVTHLPEVPEFVWTCTILHNVAQSYPSTAPRKIDEQSCAKSQPHKNWCSQVSRDISSTEPAHQHHSSVTSHRVDSSPVQISPQGSEWWSLWLDIVLGFEVSALEPLEPWEATGNIWENVGTQLQLSHLPCTAATSPTTWSNCGVVFSKMPKFASAKIVFLANVTIEN